MDTLKLILVLIIDMKYTICVKTTKDHLQYQTIQMICRNRDSICRESGSKVCTIRKIEDRYEYRDFDNTCYLYLDNMCDYPGEEYYIVTSGMCSKYITRRNEDMMGKDLNETNSNSTEYEYYYTDDNSTQPIIQAKTLRQVMAFDRHPCPKSCTDIYAPICVSVNRGFGLYFKFYTFMNHCQGDKYYCEHTKEFQPPPNGTREMVRSSMLSWSYCGSHRYLQFARFSEVASSMGHYGWLHTDARYSKIMAPNQFGNA